MKGIIFNIVEDAVTAQYGEETWDDLIERAGVGGAYTAVGTYPDKELYQLVAAASAALGVDPGALTHWLGTQALTSLAARYPEFMTPHSSTRPFLLSLNDVIHSEVRKLSPDARPPHFDFADVPGGGLSVTYRSHRPLCALAAGMIVGAGAHYGEDVAIDHEVCVHTGADACVLVCSFSRRAA